MLSDITSPPLILGNGYIGKQLSNRLVQYKIPHHVSTRSNESLIAENKFVESTQYDLDRSITDITNTRVWYLCPPSPSELSDSRMTRFLRHYKPAATPATVVYISTTGVYGDCDGAWVDEMAETQPTSERAKRRVDAEQKLQRWSEATQNRYVILRVAGIYGPGRLPLQRLRDRQPMIAESEAPWSNRIHAEDLVNICFQAMHSSQYNTIYNVADGNPTNMAHYFNTLADLSGLPRPPLVSLDDQNNGLSQGMLSYLKESRRIDNSKVLQELNIELKYPDLSSGLPAALAGADL